MTRADYIEETDRHSNFNDRPCCHRDCMWGCTSVNARPSLEDFLYLEAEEHETAAQCEVWDEVK